MAATALAVEASVLNNFVWHRRWTWADRPSSRAALTLLRFNATNGAMSLIGNLAVMLILVSGLKLNPYAANLITILICSLVNFALADRVVFTKSFLIRATRPAAQKRPNNTALASASVSTFSLVPPATRPPAAAPLSTSPGTG